jgi:hypothetical protein
VIVSAFSERRRSMQRCRELENRRSTETLVPGMASTSRAMCYDRKVALVNLKANEIHQQGFVASTVYFHHRKGMSRPPRPKLVFGARNFSRSPKMAAGADAASTLTSTKQSALRKLDDAARWALLTVLWRPSARACACIPHRRTGCIYGTR